jgi:chitinase
VLLPLGAHFESNVRLASWDVRQTYPTEGNDWDSTATEKPNRDGTQEILKPDFRYQLSANGFITAHVKPTFTFGIDFNKNFLKVPSCTVNLVADGHITFYAEASTGTDESFFCYGVTAGADLYASLDVPKVYGWDLSAPKYQIAQAAPIQIVERTCPISRRDLEHSWDLQPRADSLSSPLPVLEPSAPASGSKLLGKRGHVYGPLLSLKHGIGCPAGEEIPNAVNVACPICEEDEPRDSRDPISMMARAGKICYYQPPSDNPRCWENELPRSLQHESYQNNWTSGLETRALDNRGSKIL